MFEKYSKRGKNYPDFCDGVQRGEGIVDSSSWCKVSVKHTWGVECE